tara:strand:+ start:822 stop:1382 length:561 start_codon:yes stop_codon:yes gene_type:complete
MAQNYEQWTATDAIDKSLLDNDIHYLSGDIASDNVADAIKFIVSRDLENKKKTLKLYVNSTGGDLYECFALIDTMKNSKHTISTIGIGAVMSAAFLIFISGTKGHRYIGRNTGIMNHQHTDSWESKMHDMRAAMAENVNCETRALNIIKDAAAISLSEAKERFNSKSDQFFTARQLVDMDLADKIL